MKNQRDQLLEILATGVDFKGEITFVFDTTLDEGHEEALLESELLEIQEVNVRLDKRVQLLIVENTALKKELSSSVKKPKNTKRIYASQLSKEQVWDIRDYIKLGLGDAEIRDKMGNKFKASAVWRIRRRQAYNNIPSRPHESVQPRSVVNVGDKVVKGEGVLHDA